MPWYRTPNFAYKNDTAPKKTQACICTRDPDVSVPFYFISFSRDSLHTYATCSQKGGTHCFDVGSVIQHRQIHSQITYSVSRHSVGRNPSRRNNNAAGSRASRTNSFQSDLTQFGGRSRVRLRAQRNPNPVQRSCSSFR